MTNVQKNPKRFQTYSVNELLEFSAGLSTLFVVLADSSSVLSDSSIGYVSRLAILQRDITEEVMRRIPFKVKEFTPVEGGNGGL